MSVYLLGGFLCFQLGLALALARPRRRCAQCEEAAAQRRATRTKQTSQALE
jgi:hypothetical protein